jgi:hypothetical protein
MRFISVSLRPNQSVWSSSPCAKVAPYLHSRLGAA